MITPSSVQKASDANRETEVVCYGGVVDNRVMEHLLRRCHNHSELCYIHVWFR